MWLEIRIVIPRSWLSCLSSSRISMTLIGSSPLVGSSRIRNSGSLSMAIARPSRCFMPSEKFFTFFLPVPCSPTNSSILATQSLPGIPRRSRFTSRFSAAVMWGNNEGLSIISPIRLRAWVNARSPLAPNSSILPPDGKASPVTMRISVDFPAPFCPIKPYMEPLRIDKFTLSSAALPLNFLDN
ncbi:hypothetical protein D3C73_790810 [compost metagenome]